MYLPLLLSALGALLFSATVQSASSFTPARPPALPLAVKSPYLSAWFPAGTAGGNGGYLPGHWPIFWTGNPLGWTGLVRVDGNTFVWMGAPLHLQPANQTSFEYTSTKSIVTIAADEKVQVKVTFLSPITPKDLKRQSLLFSYMNVEVSSLDGSNHDVQIYTDISGEWAAGDSTSKAEWAFGTTQDGIYYHKVWKQNQNVFNEWNDQAQWGNIYYSTQSAADGLTYRSGADNDVRGSFAKDGKLDNSKDTNFRAINDAWPVFAYAKNLGSVGSETKSTLFTIGLCQDEAIQFLGAEGLKTQQSLWKSYFDDDLAALSFFYKDFSESTELSTGLDDMIAKDSKDAAGDNYALLTTLGVRQAFGATQLVGTQDKHYLFLKEISSNGNTQTVDVIYPASPLFYYLNPELVRLLLEPHFENQESGHYPNASAIHDLGARYPNATGHPDGKDESMPIEECGNQIIMVLHYFQRTGNVEYIKSHYRILKQWAGFLVSDSLLPGDQLSTDDFAGTLANQTNLALKGIIGIEAMARISQAAGEMGDAANFTKIAHDYIGRWEQLGLNKDANPPHAMLNYNNASTHGLLYNLYNDRLLGLGLVPQEVYDIQDKFYPTQLDNYGVPLDTRNRYWTKSDWQIFCAAISSKRTRDMFINGIAKWVNETPISRPYSDLFQTNDGNYPQGIEFTARPVVGGLFAILLLDNNATPPGPVIIGPPS